MCPQRRLLAGERQVDVLTVDQIASPAVMPLVAEPQERGAPLGSVSSAVVDVLPVDHHPRRKEADRLGQRLGDLQQAHGIAREDARKGDLPSDGDVACLGYYEAVADVLDGDAPPEVLCPDRHFHGMALLSMKCPSRGLTLRKRGNLPLSVRRLN